MQILSLPAEFSQAVDSMYPMPLLGFYPNGNTLNAIFEDGTKIVYYPDGHKPEYEYATSIDIKITNKCNNGCPFCFENSSPKGIHGNLNHPIFDTLQPYQEIAIGGGNPLLHPNLISFLERMKKKKVICNITIHQKDFEENYSLIKFLTDEKLIYGVGVSLANPTPELIKKLQTIPTAIVHVINGIVTREQMNQLADHNLKLLILGYKFVRNGCDYWDRHSAKIGYQSYCLERFIDYYTSSFASISFDNAAVEQLGMKSKCSKEEWKTNYMGDDGTQTFYIDLVNEQYAMNSTSLERKPIKNGQTVKEMFQEIKK